MSPVHSNAATALELLHYSIAIGADETIEPDAIDRTAMPALRAAAPAAMPVRAMAAAETPAPAPAPAAAPAARAAPTAAAMPVSADLRAQLAGCDSVESLRAALLGFHECPLRATATTTVFTDGNPAAPLMLIGEAPGAEEDRLGLPFVGESGRLLDRMLAAIGLDRGGVLITNVVYWRPPGNRKPSPQELALCRPFVERLIALVQPRLLVTLGDSAAKSLLGRAEGITSLRGRPLDFHNPADDRKITTIPTFHPAYLLRSPAQKREAWRDMRAISAALSASSSQ